MPAVRTAGVNPAARYRRPQTALNLAASSQNCRQTGLYNRKQSRDPSVASTGSSMSTVTVPVEQRLVLYGVDWKSYERMLRAFSNHPGVHLTYDRGSLEIMTLSYEHETTGRLLGRFVIVLTEELGLPINGGGSTTFRRRKRQRGLEPDDCYWIASEALIRGKDRINLQTDPPPDLALEIDITRSSLNRMAIYAVLRIPELWRLENQRVVCYLLGADGHYSVSTSSRAFPGLEPAELSPFLAMRRQMDDNAVVRQFRAWVRQQFSSGGSAGNP
jgi:Uma2 family endonuclease